MRECSGRFLDVEVQLAFLPVRFTSRDAALHREREPQLGLDIGADAVERVDERECELDRAAGIVLAGDRQTDDDAEHRFAAAPVVGVASVIRRVFAVGGARDVEKSVVLERDVARDLVELVDEARRTGRTELALERRHAAQDAFEHVDVLALALLARRCIGDDARQIGDRVRAATAAIFTRSGNGASVAALGSRQHRLDGDGVDSDCGARHRLRRGPRRNHAQLGRHERRELLREVTRVDQVAGALAPLELEPAELVLQIARGLEPIGAMERSALRMIRSSDSGSSGAKSRGRGIAPALTISSASLPLPWNSGRAQTSS